MNTDRELMQQALEALEDARGELAAYHEDAQGEDYNSPALNDTITALRERLAQTEQELGFAESLAHRALPRREWEILAIVEKINTPERRLIAQEIRNLLKESQ